MYECVRGRIMGTTQPPARRIAGSAQRASPRRQQAAPPVPKSLLDTLSKWKWSA